MSRETLIEHIRRFHEEMRKLTVGFVRVSGKRYDRVIKRVEDLDDTDLLGLHEWLRGLYQGQYSVIQKIYNLVPNPDVAWANYAALDVQGLQEQIMMNRELPKLRELWKTPFKPTKKRIKHDKTAKSEEPTRDSAGVSIRSSCHGANESNY